jgi:hypothetical protein
VLCSAMASSEVCKKRKSTVALEVSSNSSEMINLLILLC